ncbi:DedA family protein [Deinococcus geothermalis]|uniref:DedA-like membrane protein n=1 Tax=Deinococcus geothermalis (strain DSM 11300 / CIP 105573 / AG-3a) TaxID=319795 RepID=Q1J2R4_DEIGD|nr:DedA family protein [Deinococcus geothermalis]ABF44220.1 DedA-like membrane protein [Deinococcus geothermalis DSM 11300]
MNLQLWLASLNPTLRNAATFGLLTLEGAGVPGVPGVIPMLAQSAMIDAGHTTLEAALLWGVLGNWCGSLLGYAAGRWGSHRIPARWTRSLRGERTQALLGRWGAGVIILSRTVGSLRTPITLGAGAARYPFPRFVLFSFLGALLHVGVWQVVLWRFGPALLPGLERVGLEVAAGLAVALVLGLGWLWIRRRQRSGSAA